MASFLGLLVVLLLRRLIIRPQTERHPLLNPASRIRQPQSDGKPLVLSNQKALLLEDTVVLTKAIGIGKDLGKEMGMLADRMWKKRSVNERRMRIHSKWNEIGKRHWKAPVAL
jgi:hypothetical protein